MSSDKQKASGIIAASRGISCTWGAIPQARVVFVIDVSASMDTTFTLNGVTYTRLQYVQKEIDQVIRYQLSSDQAFNVEIFSGSPSFWSPGIQPVTPANIDSATAYAAALTTQPTGTGTGAALTAAFGQTGLE